MGQNLRYFGTNTTRRKQITTGLRSALTAAAARRNGTVCTRADKKKGARTMEGSYTIKQVIEITTDILKGIRLTVEQMDEIGKPIYDAVSNLKAVINAINANEQQQAAAEEQPEEAAEENEDV